MMENQNMMMGGQNNMMVDQNMMMGGQNNMMVDQNMMMVDQNNMMVDQNMMMGGQNMVVVQNDVQAYNNVEAYNNPEDRIEDQEEVALAKKGRMCGWITLFVFLVQFIWGLIWVVYFHMNLGQMFRTLPTAEKHFTAFKQVSNSSDNITAPAASNNETSQSVDKLPILSYALPLVDMIGYLPYGVGIIVLLGGICKGLSSSKASKSSSRADDVSKVEKRRRQIGCGAGWSLCGISFLLVVTLIFGSFFHLLGTRLPQELESTNFEQAKTAAETLENAPDGEHILTEMVDGMAGLMTASKNQKTGDEADFPLELPEIQKDELVRVFKEAVGMELDHIDAILSGKSSGSETVFEKAVKNNADMQNMIKNDRMLAVITVLYFYKNPKIRNFLSATKYVPGISTVMPGPLVSQLLAPSVARAKQFKEVAMKLKDDETLTEAFKNMFHTAKLLFGIPQTAFALVIGYIVQFVFCIAAIIFVTQSKKHANRALDKKEAHKMQML